MGDGHGEITHLLRQQRGSTVYGPSFILWTYVLLPHAHRQGATTKLIDFSSVQRERKSGDFSPLCGASFSMFDRPPSLLLAPAATAPSEPSFLPFLPLKGEAKVTRRRTAAGQNGGGGKGRFPFSERGRNIMLPP